MKTLKSTLKRKINEAAGVNRIKVELLIAMAKNDKCKKILLRVSNTKLIEKKNARPTLKDFRPIALTGILDKLSMSLAWKCKHPSPKSNKLNPTLFSYVQQA